MQKSIIKVIEDNIKAKRCKFKKCYIVECNWGGDLSLPTGYHKRFYLVTLYKKKLESRRW